MFTILVAKGVDRYTDRLAIVTDTLVKGQLSGLVTDQQGAPIPFATVSLLSFPDSSVVKNVLSDTTGQYHFFNVPSGNYLVKVSVLGFTISYSRPVKMQAEEGVHVGRLTMAASATTLTEIEIAGRKAPVERKGDRFIVNVEKSAMASGNSIDLLKSTPFVSLSASNEVQLQGKKTMFLVDNKPIPEASLQDILQMIPAGNISSVELITNPSARYDAAYGAVINIITKKKQTEGITGNVRLEGAQGKYGQYGGNSRITYKKKNVTLFGLGAYTRSDQQSVNLMDRELNATEKPDLLKENITRTFYQNFYSFQGGTDINLTDNQTIGALATARIVRSDGLFASSNIFSKLQAPVDSILYTNSPLDNKGETYNFNLNYHLLADSGKNELTLLSTYTRYNSNFFQYFPSVLVDGTEAIIRTPAIYQITNNTNINILIGQADYTHKFRQHWQLETGLKYQRTDSKNSILYEDNSSGQFAVVPGYSNNNHLREAIYAGYAILSKNWVSDRLQAGLRVENTEAEFINNFKQNYLKFFPTINYQHDFSKQYNFSLSYKKVISRAPYNELVPYTIFVNQYTVFTGNPALQPQYDNIFSLNTQLNKLNISFNYTIIKGMFGQFPIKQDYNTKVTYFALQNLDNAQDFHIDVFYPLQITSWWSTQNSGSVFGYSKAEGKVLNQSFRLSSDWFNIKSSHTFNFSKNIKLEVTAYYYSSLTSELTSIGEVGNIDAGLLISVLNNKGQLRIGGTDILKRNVYFSGQSFEVYRSRKDRYGDSRRLSLGFTYNFGKTKITTRPRKLGNNEALQRIQ
ncbi:outer membrane beta-barrel protein [uncultured Chitinophaga sp.]|uniref:outer membrane beta-barrel protein n=1 Tax=uncultured Chitinophaga sp. TaxID=339340 RepID=UPI002630F1B9|nr:outer membrane beta-barrel protein [uncultured Chitinophaga sp.]